MRVRLLGPVDVMVDGAVRPVSGLRRKAILAILGLYAGEIVSADRLQGIVWRDGAPGLNTLQSHVSHLRSVLGSKAAILAKPPGYVLDLGEDGTDVLHAERLLRQAGRLIPRGEPASCARRWRCGAAGRWPTSPGSPGWKNRRSGWNCCAGRSTRPLRKRGSRPVSTRRWCPISSGWSPTIRSTNGCTGS